jgi:Cu/Ag efflux pump CusA
MAARRLRPEFCGRVILAIGVVSLLLGQNTGSKILEFIGGLFIAIFVFGCLFITIWAFMRSGA